MGINDNNNAPGLARNIILENTNNNVAPNNNINNDIIVAIPPSHYMVSYSNDKNTYASSITFHDPFYLGILGANFMMGHDVYFDNDQHRIGFSESRCNEMQEEVESFEKESSSG